MLACDSMTFTPAHRRITFISTALMMAATCGASEIFGWWRGEPILQNTPPATEFIAARWHFGTNGAVGHMGWAHNYPYSDQNLNRFLNRTTGLDVDLGSYRIVELGKDEVFEYPFAYVSEPGEMELTEKEVKNMREYIARGGFVLIDDFDGPWQWEQLRSQVKRAFPELDFVQLPIDHPVFQMIFDLDDLQGMAEYVSGGHIAYYGLIDERGTVVMLAGLNNDLANFWEWYEQPSMPLKPAADAFRLGTNAVMYALTH
jgi:hypothetical protein